METGKKCQLRIKTDWKNLGEAKEQCGNISECTMFYEACNGKFSYCRASEYTEYVEPGNIKIQRCSNLYIKGTIVRQDERKEDTYYVQLDGGPMVKRNRIYLKLIHAAGKAVRFFT